MLVHVPVRIDEQAAVSRRLSRGESRGTVPRVTVNTKAPCALTTPERDCGFPRTPLRRLIGRWSVVAAFCGRR